MIEALPGIEPGDGKRCRESTGQKRIAERKTGINRIGGRTPVAVLERKSRKAGHFLGEEMRKGAKIKRARLAFKAEEMSGIFRPGRALDE
jgi:hypothetical protein